MARTDETLERGAVSAPGRREDLRIALWWALGALVPMILFAAFVAVAMAVDHMMHVM